MPGITYYSPGGSLARFHLNPIFSEKAIQGGGDITVLFPDSPRGVPRAIHHLVGALTIFRSQFDQANR